MTIRSGRRASRGNRFGMAVIAVIVLLLIAVLTVQSRGLKKKIVSYTATNASLESQIEIENGRTRELEILPEYVASREYIEKAAREKFGLVYQDEIILKPEGEEWENAG